MDVNPLLLFAMIIMLLRDYLDLSGLKYSRTNWVHFKLLLDQFGKADSRYQPSFAHESQNPQNLPTSKLEYCKCLIPSHPSTALHDGYSTGFVIVGCIPLHCVFLIMGIKGNGTLRFPWSGVGFIMVSSHPCLRPPDASSSPTVPLKTSRQFGGRDCTVAVDIQKPRSFWRVTCRWCVLGVFFKKFHPNKEPTHKKQKKTSSRVMVFMLLSSGHPGATPGELYIFQLVSALVHTKGDVRRGTEKSQRTWFSCAVMWITWDSLGWQRVAGPKPIEIAAFTNTRNKQTHNTNRA